MIHALEVEKSGVPIRPYRHFGMVAYLPEFWEDT